MIHTLSQYLWLFGSLIFFLLGYLHLSSCFSVSEYLNRGKNKSNEKENKESEAFTLKYRAGFSLKHSIVAVYFGAVNLILAGGYFSMVKQSYVLMAITIGISLFYLYLSIHDWPLLLRFLLWLANCFFIAAVISLIIG